MPFVLVRNGGLSAADTDNYQCRFDDHSSTTHAQGWLCTTVTSASGNDGQQVVYAVADAESPPFVLAIHANIGADAHVEHNSYK